MEVRFVEGLDHGYPRVHYEIAALCGASEAGGSVLNLRMIMLGFRNGLAEVPITTAGRASALASAPAAGK